VAVLERSNYSGDRIGETLPPRARALLESLDAWDDFQRDGHLPSPAIVSLWGNHRLYENWFDGQTGTGWHINRARFDATLAKAAQRAGAQVYQRATLRQCSRAGSGLWEVSACVEGKAMSLRASWAVDATGRLAWFARRQSAQRLAWDQLVGVVGYGTGSDDDPRTCLEAAPNGWWYSAQLPGKRSVAAYMTDAGQLPRGRLALRSYWQKRLGESSLAGAVFGIAAPGELQALPANSSILSRLRGPNWLAIGDAAATFDPLSGAGVCKAIEDARAAALALVDAFDGRLSALEKYVMGVELTFEQFLITRRRYYALINRWPDSPFWRARQTVDHRMNLMH
jgi:flavin-dependent dehydrogenase